ncbi:MAG: aldose epimerase family protein [Parashewanella sp.]
MIRVKALEPWITPDGEQVERVLVDNGVIAMEVLSLGGIIRSLWVPNKHGDRQNVVLGCDSTEQYLQQQAHLGAVAGRYANRIANGKLTRSGNVYQLDINKDGNCLHGGHQGFSYKNWQMGSLPDGVRLSLHSPDGDMGFPGNCNVQLDYRIVGANLFVEFQATVDKACPINLTQHSYFNLDGSTHIGQHSLQSDCRQVLKTDATGIPTTIISSTKGPLDFNTEKMLGLDLMAKELQPTEGFDHCFLMPKTLDTIQRFGYLKSNQSGIKMTLHTNQSGVQLYTANFLQGTVGKGNQTLQQHQGVCIEPQCLPDAPNQTELLGNVWLEAGEVYHHISRYQFDVTE